MNLEDAKEDRPRREAQAAEDTETNQDLRGKSSAEMHASSSQKKRRTPVKEVGEALKSVYQRAVDEKIPPEMLDLLGKLG